VKQSTDSPEGLALTIAIAITLQFAVTFSNKNFFSHG
tara:strand:+ start:135 stop:245 length:111 start_codon:yes stop_codon:yes gene_type:complete